METTATPNHPTYPYHPTHPNPLYHLSITTSTNLNLPPPTLTQTDRSISISKLTYTLVTGNVQITLAFICKLLCVCSAINESEDLL